ncbi:MAG: methyltransferase domain-containing protein [Candidatus Dormibacteraeota bacterium]|nr:methyltransferase domain-containing protein [Candidatus Dormibacteraeota bacterium]
MRSKELYPPVFSRHALAYQCRLEDIMSRGESAGRTRIMVLTEAQPGMRVLDLACGPGTLSRRLAAMVSPGGEVLGVDLAPGMIELARAMNIPATRFELMDIEQLALPDASFDAAVCGHGLQFAPDLLSALKEARRVLRPGAALAASVPVSPREGGVWRLLDSVVDRWLPAAPKAVDQGPTRATVQDPVAFRRAALEAGFATARVELIEEDVHWESAQHMVSNFMGWVDCATRMEGVDDVRRQTLMDDAVETLKREHPGPIETKGRIHVLFAQA